jgi:membrane-associated phospholipid phosphatase
VLNVLCVKGFFATLPRNLMGCFTGWKLTWHLVAILLTVILVLSGFDWGYYLATRSPELRAWMFPAVVIGGLLPLYLPLALLVAGYINRNPRTVLTGWAIAQAELLGALIVVVYKAFTGRAHPAHVVDADISHVFHFGFLRGGVFWGWPSSHTTVAFAMATTVFTLCPKQRWLGVAAILYAFYIGVGVSMTIHWFSDFVAGAMVGSIVGTVVGRSFGKTFSAQHSTSDVQVTPESDAS